MNRLRGIADSFTETVLIAKTVLSTIWFWVPVVYALFFLAQLWLMFFVHPLTAFVAPSILGFYAVYLEGRRAASRYSLKKTMFLSAAHTFGSGPEPIDRQEWEVEQTVEEYADLLKKGKKKRR
jgi:hypothetical protein